VKPVIRIWVFGEPRVIKIYDTHRSAMHLRLYCALFRSPVRLPN